MTKNDHLQSNRGHPHQQQLNSDSEMIDGRAGVPKPDIPQCRLNAVSSSSSATQTTHYQNRLP
jgi:hypothetical protein